MIHPTPAKAAALRLTLFLALVLSLSLSLVWTAGCRQDDGHLLTPLDLVVPSYSDDDLRQLGMDVDREIQKKVEVINDPVVSGYINELGQEIASQIEPQPFIYRFRVIRGNTLNAFALPGGYVYLHSETILRAGSVDELAGVIGHEIAHVNARHFSRREAKSALPSLLARVVGMGAAVAANEPGIAVASEGVNQSLQIAFTREYEAEADKLGAIWVTRAGFDAEQLTHFLDKIVQSEPSFPDGLPPYLATHPFPEDRIRTIEAEAKDLKPRRQPNPALARDLPRVQARLAYLLDAHRSSLTAKVPASPRSQVDPVLAEADRLAKSGDVDGALLVLGRIDDTELGDPRVPFRIGDLLYQQHRYAEAAASYQRTLEIDTSRALVFYKLGLAFKGTGERHRAVYAFEQAALRAGEQSQLHERADWEIFKLTFPCVEADGFGDDAGPGAGAQAEATHEFHEGDPELRWWAKLGSRFTQYRDLLVVRWTDPSGSVAQQKAAKTGSKDRIRSVLDFDAQGARPAGTWRLELLLEDDVIAERTVVVSSAAR